jgi:hypothetical protein
MIVRKPFWYVYDFDRLRLNGERLGRIVIDHTFEVCFYFVVSRFPCEYSFKIPGQRRTIKFRSDKIVATPQFPLPLIEAPRIRRKHAIHLFAEDVKRELDGRKWNRLQISFSGYHVFNVKVKR